MNYARFLAGTRGCIPLVVEAHRRGVFVTRRCRVEDMDPADRLASPPGVEQPSEGERVIAEFAPARFTTPSFARITADMVYSDIDYYERLDMMDSMINLGAFFSDGAHVIILSPEVEEALGQMDMPVDPALYHQPFPCVGVQTSRVYAISRWDAPNQRLCVGVFDDDFEATGLARNFHCTYRAGETIDDGFLRVFREPEYAEVVALLRLIANTCLFATTRGLVAQPDTNPSHRARCEDRVRRMARKNPDLAEQSRQELLTIPFRFTLDQRVPLFRTTNSTDKEESEPTGRTMSPHWRRGHWRTQHYGPGNTQTKLIAIPAVLVNADLLLGDRSASRVIYS